MKDTIQLPVRMLKVIEEFAHRANSTTHQVIARWLDDRVKHEANKWLAEHGKPDISVEVEEKSALINHGWVTFRDPSMMLIEFDLRKKYAEVLAISNEHVLVHVTAESLHKGESPDPSTIKFKFPDEKWRVHHAWCSRYTLSVLVTFWPVLSEDDADTSIWTTSRKDEQ